MRNPEGLIKSWRNWDKFSSSGSLRVAFLHCWEPLESPVEHLGSVLAGFCSPQERSFSLWGASWTLLGLSWGLRGGPELRPVKKTEHFGQPEGPPNRSQDPRRAQRGAKKSPRNLMGRHFGQTLLEQSDDTLFHNSLATAFNDF